MKNLLKLHGASREFYISDLVTHVIAENINFPEYEQAKDAKLAIVKVIDQYVCKFSALMDTVEAGLALGEG